MLAIPQTLLQAIYSGLEKETGQAALVLGLPKRIEPAETMVTQFNHDTIMQQLCR